MQLEGQPGNLDCAIRYQPFDPHRVDIAEGSNVVAIHKQLCRHVPISSKPTRRPSLVRHLHLYRLERARQHLHRDRMTSWEQAINRYLQPAWPPSRACPPKSAPVRRSSPRIRHQRSAESRLLRYDRWPGYATGGKVRQGYILHPRLCQARMPSTFQSWPRALNPRKATHAEAS